MADPSPKSAFGRYRLLEKLGEGGMAVVYRAILEGPDHFSRTVVLKRILPVLSKQPEFVKMLLAEARLCGLLHHPAIVQVHDVGEVDGEYFLAMEWVDGSDLSTVLKRCHELRRPLPAGLACFIVSELAGALAYAHALRGEDRQPLEIVHRDISPSNVMLASQGTVKLLDFGIARMRSQLRDEHTRTGTLKGKLGYMSPEQADGKRVDHRTDLFALGVLFWECLTLERLFKGTDDLDTLRRVREAKVWPPSSARPDLDPEIDAVALRLLERNLEARYQTGAEVVAALEPIIHRHEGGGAALKRFIDELGPTVRSLAVETTTPQKKSAPAMLDRDAPSLSSHAAEPHTMDWPQPDAPPARPIPVSRRRPWPLLAAALLAAGAVGGWTLWHRPPPPKEDGARAQEDSPPPSLAHKGPLRLAVLQFKNLGGDRDLELLSEGISDTVVTALGRMHDQIKLIERNQIEKALKEIDLGQTKYADKQTAVALGRVTGAEMVLLGGYQRAEGRMRVSARLVSAENGEVVDTFELTRAADKLFDVQDAVAASLSARFKRMLQ